MMLRSLFTFGLTVLCYIAQNGFRSYLPSRPQKVQKRPMITIQQDDFDITAAINTLKGSRTDIGAIVSFLGLVRDMNQNGPISAMTLEHYPGMAEKELETIEQEAHKRWELQGSLIIHRYGKLLPGDNIVLVLTASPHRIAAFEAAQFMMDFLKSKAPFWKNEQGDGKPQWVTAKQDDEDRISGWQASPMDGTKPKS